MGTEAHVVVVGGAAHLLGDALGRIAELERRWSRFIPSSELCRLNRHAGSAVEVSADTSLLVRRALEGWHLSGGAFDPTVLGDVVRAGYDRTFDELDDAAPPPWSPLQLGCDGIVVDGTTVQLPLGTGLDSGGIGKGLAADLITGELLDAGAAGALVNLGGDVRVRGEGPDDRGWTVALRHPADSEPLVLLGLADGAVATSTTLGRRWRSAGEDRHHVIDPRSGAPSDSGVELASVVADHGWRAEVLAKAVLVNGGDHLFDILGGTGAEGLAVHADGSVVVTAGLGSFLGAAQPPRMCSRWSMDQT